MKAKEIKTPDTAKAWAILEKVVANEEHHADYKRTVELADEYDKILSGNNQDDLITNYKRLETADQKKQRIHIYIPETPSAAQKTTSWFTQIESTDRVVKKARLEDPTSAKQAELNERMSSFYGEKSAEDYLFERHYHYEMFDPNAWLVVGYRANRDSDGAATEAFRTFPIEITSKQAYNFQVLNGSPVWLITRHGITIRGADGAEQNGDLWHFYTKDLTIRLEQVGEDPRDLAEKETAVSIKEKSYYRKDINTKSGIVPCRRFGHIGDTTTKGRTFVSPIHSASHLFRELINRKSELDLSWAVHGFPEKREYAPSCDFRSKDDGICRNGTLSITGNQCQKCKGTGKQRHFTAQEILTYEMPDSKDGLIPLSELVHYANPPKEVMDLQIQAVKELPQKIFQATFGLLFSEKPGQPLTATEIIRKYGNVYSVLQKYARQHSSLWCFVALSTSIHTGIDAEKVQIEHKFPNDFNLITESELMVLLGAAKNNNAPYDVIRNYERQILAKQNADNKKAVAFNEAKERFKPFRSKNQSEIQGITLNLAPTNYYRVLHEYFDVIFTEIELMGDDFVLAEYEKQKEIVDEKVGAITEMIRSENEVSPQPSEF